VLLRLAYLTVTNTLSLMRLLPMSERDKEVEILVLRHQLAHPATPDTQTRLHPRRPVLLAGLLHHLPLDKLRSIQLLVRPDTILRWHRDLLKRRHAAASVPRRRDDCGPSAPSAPWSYVS
jgi:putative transposase